MANTLVEPSEVGPFGDPKFACHPDVNLSYRIWRVSTNPEPRRLSSIRFPGGVTVEREGGAAGEGQGERGQYENRGLGGRGVQSSADRPAARMCRSVRIHCGGPRSEERG